MGNFVAGYTVNVKVRFTPEEKKRVEKECEQLNCSMSEYIRACVFHRKLQLPEIRRIDSSTLAELRRQGGLLKKYYLDTKGENKDLTRQILQIMKKLCIGIAQQLEVNVDVKH